MSDRRQRQKEQRAAKREAEKKREARRELGRRLGTAIVFGLIVVGIFAVSGLFGGEQTTLPGSYEAFRDQETACGAEPPPPEEIMSFEAPEPQTDITASTDVSATLATSCGDIVIELDPANYPETVNSFVFLVREGFFDGQVFYRISENFVVEAGDPQADGTGGPGYLVPDEYPEDDEYVYEEDVVFMANRGSRSTGSQFRIVVGDDARFLTPQFNVLGRVVSGQDTLDRMLEVERGISQGTVERSLPLETVYIESATIDIADS